MDYPRELKLSPEREEALKLYLDQELITHTAERGNWVDDLKRWQADYWATPSQKEATFPFKGAANVVIPLSAIAVEATHARSMTQLFALEQFNSVRMSDPRYPDGTEYDLEKAINWELLKGCDIYKFADSTLLENRKLGSCVGKVSYEKIIKTAVREVDGKEVDFDIVTKQGPQTNSIPVANFLMPFTASDPQSAPWVGEEHLCNPYQLQEYIDSGYFRKDVYDKLNGYFGNGQQLSSTPYTQFVRDIQNQNPIQWPREIGWTEIWLCFDIDGYEQMDNMGGQNTLMFYPGKKREIVVHYHRPSRTFFSIRYNWFSDLHRPYRIGRYQTMENRWAGIGIGKMNEQFQEIVTVGERQRIDNATLANMRMFKAKQGSGIGPQEPLFPGKIFLVDDMDDFAAIEGGSEVFPSSYNNSQQNIVFSQQRTSVNELTLGMPQVGTPGTATGDLTRVQESNRKFDYFIKNEKRFLQEISMDVLCVQSQFGFRDARIFDTLTNGQVVKQILQSDPNDLRAELIFELFIVGQNNNELVERANWTQYAQMLTQYYTQMVQLAQMTQNPQLIALVMGYGMKAGTEAMRQISEGYNIRGVERLLLPQSLIQTLMGVSNGSQNVQNGGAGNRPPQSVGQGEGVGNSLALVR